MFKKSVTVALLVFVAAFSPLLSACGIFSRSQKDKQDTPQYGQSIIAHAGGGMSSGIIDYKYINSVEGLEHHYARGTRLFEYDFMFTTDGELVGVHSWIEAHINGGIFKPVSLSTYESTKKTGGFTGMTFKNLLNYMEKYRDISIIIDTKEANELSTYAKIVQDAQAKNPDLLDRIIPQLYQRSMYDSLENMHPFKQYVFTLYKTDDSNEVVYEFVKNHPKIKILTADGTRVSQMTKQYVDSIHNLGTRVFVHTINSFDDMNGYRARGVSGFYSDRITQNEYYDKYQRP